MLIGGSYYHYFATVGFLVLSRVLFRASVINGSCSLLVVGLSVVSTGVSSLSLG